MVNVCKLRTGKPITLVNPEFRVRVFSNTFFSTSTSNSKEPILMKQLCFDLDPFPSLGEVKAPCRSFGTKQRRLVKEDDFVDKLEESPEPTNLKSTLGRNTITLARITPSSLQLRVVTRRSFCDLDFNKSIVTQM